jgi:hypothetical protein
MIAENGGLSMRDQAKNVDFRFHPSDRRATPAGLVYNFPPQLLHYSQSKNGLSFA